LEDRGGWRITLRWILRNVCEYVVGWNWLRIVSSVEL
jgi:hypothetical protein